MTCATGSHANPVQGSPATFAHTGLRVSTSGWCARTWRMAGDLHREVDKHRQVFAHGSGITEAA